MSSSWFLARRLLLWRQERRRLNRSAVMAVVGVAVGSAVLILSLSILNGFEAEVHDSLMVFEHQAVLLPRSSQVDVEAAKLIVAVSQPFLIRFMVSQFNGAFANCGGTGEVAVSQLPRQRVHEVYFPLDIRGGNQLGFQFLNAVVHFSLAPQADSSMIPSDTF